MITRYKILLAPLLAATASIGICSVSYAQVPVSPVLNIAMSGQELPPYLQCVPYAREVSGIDIYGDAHTWWEQAAGRFERGDTPRVGAVMAFMPTGNMQLGHVAAVARVIDSRTVLLDHANWSPIDGRRGQIERNVRAIDVSPNNDWSEVRVWYHPLQGLGTTAWPVHGFIYSDGTPNARPRQQFARATPQPTRAEPSKTFLAAFTATPERTTVPQRAVTQRRATQRASSPQIAYDTARPLPTQRAADSGDRDVVQRAVALYD